MVASTNPTKFWSEIVYTLGIHNLNNNLPVNVIQSFCLKRSKANLCGKDEDFEAESVDSRRRYWTKPIR